MGDLGCVSQTFPVEFTVSDTVELTQLSLVTEVRRDAIVVVEGGPPPRLKKKSPGPTTWVPLLPHTGFNG